MNDSIKPIDSFDFACTVAGYASGEEHYPVYVLIAGKQTPVIGIVLDQDRMIVQAAPSLYSIYIDYMIETHDIRNHTEEELLALRKAIDARLEALRVSA